MEEVQRYRNCDMPYSGRPRATTAVDVHYLRISAWKNPDSNATMLNIAFRASTVQHITTQTVHNRLHDAQLLSRRPWRGPSLHSRHHAAWYRWAQQHSEWTPRNSHHVLFTDECHILNQKIVGFLFGGNLVRLNVFETVSSECSKVVVPSCFGVALCGGRCTPLVVMECTEMALRYMIDNLDL